MIRQASYLIILAITLYSFKTMSSQLDLIYYWAIIFLASQITFTLVFYFSLKKYMPIRVNKKNILKYLITAIVVFGITYVLMDEFLVYDEKIFVFMPNLLVFALIGVGGYISVTYIIDAKTRNLVKAIISEIKNRR